MKEMKGWKVINARDRKSFGFSDNPYEVTYPVNVVTSPKLTGSLLFFFKNKEDAFNYSNLSCAPSLTVPCIAYNPRKIHILALNENLIEKFWQLKKSHKKINIPIRNPQNGSWGAESIKCLE